MIYLVFYPYCIDFSELVPTRLLSDLPMEAPLLRIGSRKDDVGSISKPGVLGELHLFVLTAILSLSEFANNVLIKTYNVNIKFIAHNAFLE